MTVQVNPPYRLPDKPRSTFRVSTRNNAKAWARKFEARLIEPGIISYKDQGCGIAFLTKENIAASIDSFVGRPLILTRNLKHKKITPAQLEQDARGYITDVYYNPDDGWFWCRGICHDDDAKEAINRVGFCSCAYEVSQSGSGGQYHAIPYDEEILSFSGEHLAIVDNPRYEGATIRLNSKNTSSNMSLLKWFKKPASRQNATEVPPAAPAAAAKPATTEPPVKENSAPSSEDIDGTTELEIPTRENGKTEKVTLATLVDVYNAREDGISPEAEIEINGKGVPVSALINAYNAQEEEDSDEEKKNKKNAEEEDEKKDKENSKSTPAAKQNFRVLMNARQHGHVLDDTPRAPDDLQSRCNRGNDAYGTKPAAK